MFDVDVWVVQAGADLWLINSCTVKDPSQAAFMHLVNKAKEGGVPVVVAGCVSQADRGLAGLEDVSMVGVSQIGKSTSGAWLSTWSLTRNSIGGELVVC